MSPVASLKDEINILKGYRDFVVQAVTFCTIV